MSDDPATLALHADASVPDGPDVAPPIRVSSTFDRSGQADLVYRRDRHVTTERLETVIGALERGHAVAYPSGMAAAAAVLAYLTPARLSLPGDVYHGVADLVGAGVERGRWESVEPGGLGDGDVHWVETPSNPKCLITDIAAVSRRGPTVVVDSTFATPVLQRPLALGADFAIHSSTKFIGGHSDAMGGLVVCGDAGAAEALRAERTISGAIPGSLDVWLALRGVRTLVVRIERQSATADLIARFLAERVERVWYPGLESHPGHDVARTQMRAFGAVLSFEVGSYERAATVVSALRLFRRATSLGGVESLAEHRREVDPHAPESLVRLSVGLEAPADLIADLERALEV